MCGICGVVQIEGSPRDVIPRDRLEAMSTIMTHRGPDDHGLHVEPGIAIAARRLSIVDVAGGHQPFANEDGTVVGAQNGELYNHGDIRERLIADGHRFRSRCDTEILPHLYEAHGIGFAERLRGKFAVVVWDAKNRRTVLARDRLGVKPLYWARVGDRVVFASELKSVMASGLVPSDLDYEALGQYLALGFVPGPRTPFAAVHKLAPGALLVIEDGRVEERAYWAYPEPRPEQTVRPIGEYADELKELLGESVRMRLMSDVPLGAMLSGGLDSSVLVALMAEASAAPVETFAVAFREDGDQNELEPARRVAGLFGCRHHEVELSLTDERIDLDELVWHLDEPVAELSTVGFFALSRVAAEHVTVALAGQGADELFAGYRKHAVAHAIGRAHIPPSLLAPLASMSLGPDPLKRLLGAFSARTPGERLLAMSGQLEPELAARLWRRDPASVDRTLIADRITDRLGHATGTPLATLLYLDAQLGLVDNMLHYFDRMSMAHSLEVRVPYLDHRLVEWAATLPDQVKIRGRERKRVLRHMARSLLPADIIDRPKVSFVRRSAGLWLEHNLAGAAGERLLASDARCHDLLDRTVVATLVDEFKRGDRSRSQLLLGITLLEIWLDRFAQPWSSATAAAA